MHNIPVVEVESSNVAAIGYDEELKVLRVVFKGKTAYDYSGVPKDQFRNIKNAKSIGNYLSTNIKDNFKVEKIDFDALPKNDPDTEVLCCSVCPEHFPLIFTMTFPGSAYYCLNCGETFTTKDDYSVFPITDDLKAVRDEAEKLYAPLRMKIFLNEGFVGGCDKCSSMKDAHKNHLTDDENRQMMESLDQLKKFIKDDLDL